MKQFGQILAATLLFVCGCASVQDYIHNGFKVGPNYQKPSAPVAHEYLAARAPQITTGSPELKNWWMVFNDPTLNTLMEIAYRQNLDVQTAGTRILEARAIRNIAAGNLFPQLQEAVGEYSRNQRSRNTATPIPNASFDNWASGFNLAWELDFWGRFRRAVESADADVDATVENYDDVLVLLFAEVAATYVDIRTFQERIGFARDNIAKQKVIAEKAEFRQKAGVAKGGRLEPAQQNSNLYNTEALLHSLEIGLRQANNRLCVLLGMPPRDLIAEMLDEGRIPHAPPVLAVGVPADLLRRRPDVLRSERLVAAQSARIGVATSDLLPRFALLGSIGYEADNLAKLFESKSFTGTIAPSFRWDILNYGRILNGIRVQDARFQRTVLEYQNTVLRAGREVEDALVAFVKFQLRAQKLTRSAAEAKVAADVTVDRIEKEYSTNLLFVTQSFLTAQQDQEAVARGNIALSLIQAYKALGGGWQMRLDDPNCQPQANAVPNVMPEEQLELMSLPDRQSSPHSEIQQVDNSSAMRARLLPPSNNKSSK